MSSVNVLKSVEDLRKVGGFGGVKGTELRRSLIKNCLNNGAQNVHTPFSLCKEMIGKLDEVLKNVEMSEMDASKDLRNQEIAVICNVEFVETLIFDFGVKPEKITFFADSRTELAFVGNGYGIKPLGVKLFLLEGTNNEGKTLNSVEVLDSILETGNMKKKFGLVFMNPPYQGATGTNNTLWNKFVKTSVDKLLKEDGYLCAIHPSGWRDAAGDFKEAQNVIKSKQIEYLEIHDREDGVNTFGAQTAYDWYVLKNTKNKNNKKTTIKCHDGTIESCNLSDMEFIPNGNFSEIEKLMAKKGDEKCEVLSSYSAYEIRKKWMSTEQTEEFKYPCVYTILKDGTLNLYWSKINTNGHFGIPKVIFSNGTSLPMIDSEGKYGLTQFSYAIVNVAENLPLIKKALDNPKFLELMEQCQLIGKHRYHYKLISLFRKDFYKDFV